MSEDIKNAIEHIKRYRRMDEEVHIKAPKDSIAYVSTGICLKYWDMAIQALKADVHGNNVGKIDIADGDRAVSLNNVIATIYNSSGDFKNDFDQGFFADKIRALPPVKERPKGHWIMKHRNVNKIEYHTGEDILTDEIYTVQELIRYETDDPYCSECGKRADDIAQDFCGYCGAYMRGDDNETGT